MSEQIPSVEEQEKRHERIKTFATDKLDRIVDRVYGS